MLAHVWHLETPDKGFTYALRYPEAIAIAEEMGWTKTDSWKCGGYTTSNPGKKLCALLEAHRMSPTSWWNCVVGALATGADPSILSQTAADYDTHDNALVVSIANAEQRFTNVGSALTSFELLLSIVELNF